MNISDLNGDSAVSGIIFTDGHVQFKFEDGDTDKHYNVSIPVQRVHLGASTASDMVYIRVIDLKSHLPVEPKSQIYVAPPEFGAQMKAASQGFLLAVGLKSTDWPLFIQVLGSNLIIACPIQSEESVQLESLT